MSGKRPRLRLSLWCGSDRAEFLGQDNLYKTRLPCPAAISVSLSPIGKGWGYPQAAWKQDYFEANDLRKTSLERDER